jgi:acyl-CoA thioesterase
MRTSIDMLKTAEGEAILERIRQIPIWGTLQFRMDELGEGFARATVPYDPRYDGVFASFHGGLLMTIADSVACFAVMTRTGPDEPMTTTDMNIRFLAACRSDVTAHARLIKFGRTLCPVAVELFDAAGVMVAVAQVTYLRLRENARV